MAEIEYKPYARNTKIVKSVSEFVSSELNLTYCDGKIEGANAKIDKTIEFVSKLTDKLIDKKLLTLPELEECLGSLVTDLKIYTGR